MLKKDDPSAYKNSNNGISFLKLGIDIVNKRYCFLLFLIEYVLLVKIFHMKMILLLQLIQFIFFY